VQLQLAFPDATRFREGADAMRFDLSSQAYFRNPAAAIACR
jgi:hypothetical protein